MIARRELLLTGNVPHIHVIGSVNIDFVIRTATLPRAGETLGEGRFVTMPGGKGANQALAARRLGAATRLTACVGADAYADIALAGLKAAGVDLGQLVIKQDVHTGAAFINVSDDGENQIAVAPGANGLFGQSDVQDHKCDAIIAQFEVPLETVWSAVKDNDIFFCLNTAPVMPADDALLNRADLLVMNETEAAFYADALAGFKGLVAKTLGADGAVLLENGKEISRARPPKIDVVDTTGAGDCFTAALCVGLASGQNRQQALRFACAAGAAAVTKLGAQSALPTRADVEALLEATE